MLQLYSVGLIWGSVFVVCNCCEFIIVLEEFVCCWLCGVCFIDLVYFTLRDCWDYILAGDVGLNCGFGGLI